MNVYRVKYDLVKEELTTTGRRKLAVVDDEPVAQKLVVASSFEAAVEKAQAIRNDLRHGAVNKECAIRDIQLVFGRVVVAEDKEEGVS